MLRENLLQEYVDRAEALALQVANTNSVRLTQSKKGGKIVSFGLSLLDAFTHKNGPITLKAICHPANLFYTSKICSSSFITPKKLKERIAFYENKYGVVDFPDNTRYDFNKASPNIDNPMVIGLDPGPVNFGVYVGKHTIENGKIVSIDVHHSSMLVNPLSEIKSDINVSLRRMLGEIQYYYQAYSPDMVVIERFQARGFKGVIVELVNIMVGAVISQAWDIHRDKEVSIHTPTPAIWKNQVNRVTSLDNMYRKCTDIGPHRLDAALLSLYPSITDGNPYTIFQDVAFSEDYIEALNCK